MKTGSELSGITKKQVDIYTSMNSAVKGQRIKQETKNKQAL